MELSGISLAGWVHTLGCVVALAVGAGSLAAAKGTAGHRRRGRIYVLAMVAAMALSFFVYHFDIPLRGGRPGPGVFGVFHWLSVAALVLVPLGYYAASRQTRGFWAYAHPVAMTLSYAILLGGLVNELFARVDFLRLRGFRLLHGQFAPGPAVGLAQTAVDVAALTALAVFVAQVRRHRRKARG